jgi:hypothetical protein
MTRKASVPAVVTPRRADWSDWSQEHERQRIAHEIRERSAATQQAIYPRELAQKMAKDAAARVVPDWGLVRDEHRGLFMTLVKQQPELQMKEIRQLDTLLRLFADNLPAHLAPLVSDLRTILEFQIVGHERAAFFVGVETGRRLRLGPGK